MGLIGNTCFKGTPGVLKHYSGLPLASPGGPLNQTNSWRQNTFPWCRFKVDYDGTFKYWFSSYCLRWEWCFQGDRKNVRLFCILRMSLIIKKHFLRRPAHPIQKLRSLLIGSTEDRKVVKGYGHLRSSEDRKVWKKNLSILWLLFLHDMFHMHGNEMQIYFWQRIMCHCIKDSCHQITPLLVKNTYAHVIYGVSVCAYN